MCQEYLYCTERQETWQGMGTFPPFYFLCVLTPKCTFIAICLKNLYNVWKCILCKKI